jgi:hypothetical protein
MGTLREDLYKYTGKQILPMELLSMVEAENFQTTQV